MNDPAGALRARLARPKPLVMGVVNVTPDSFSGDGRHNAPDAALAQAEAMVAAGADVIDVGGESTRPGSTGIDPAEERRRVVPLIEQLVTRLPVPVSVDTSDPDIMAASADAGVALINDIRALTAPGAIDRISSTDMLVCLMHMQGEPRTMQDNPVYNDVVAEVGDFLQERIDACVAAGIHADRLWVDPGFGFGKTLRHNLTLLHGLETIVRRLDRPLLAGLSRKGTVGQLLGGVPAGERVNGSVAAALLAAERGARIVRVHDVRPTVEALTILDAVADPARAAE